MRKVDGLPPEHPLFPSPTCKPLSVQRFRQRYWNPAVEAAGIPDLRFHDLRHFAASIAIGPGRANAKTVQERLGHSSIRTTFDVYGHLFPNLEEDLADRLEVFRDGAVSGGTNVARSEDEVEE